MTANEKTTIEQSEIDHFAKDSEHWWDENGPFKPLHQLNPVRLEYIKKQICSHKNLDYNDFKALEGLSILDVGCGGGLVTEPLARMGANVAGIDADENAISVAKLHAKNSGLDIKYTAGDVQHTQEKYDIVLALEIVEHVSDIDNFIDGCADCLKPDGLLILSTLNRTAKSFALGIIAAEYVLRWVPTGTHNWKKFVKPSELTKSTRRQKLTPVNATGLVFNPIKKCFELSETDLDVNYFMTLSRV